MICTFSEPQLDVEWDFVDTFTTFLFKYLELLYSPEIFYGNNKLPSKMFFSFTCIVLAIQGWTDYLHYIQSSGKFFLNSHAVLLQVFVKLSSHFVARGS